MKKFLLSSKVLSFLIIYVAPTSSILYNVFTYANKLILEEIEIAYDLNLMSEIEHPNEPKDTLKKRKPGRPKNAERRLSPPKINRDPGKAKEGRNVDITSYFKKG